MGILCAHARDEWNNLSLAPLVIFERAAAGFLNGWSTLWKRSYQEGWKIITSLHTFLTLWISIVFVGTLDEDILMIKVRTERDKSPKKWSLEFDLTKIKMFTGEDKHWRLVSRCWRFIAMNHGVVYWDDDEKEILSLSWFIFNFEVNFHHISTRPQALNYFNNIVSSSSPQPLGTLGLKKFAVCRITILLQ